ncbi:Histidinol-phosphate aminotransferase [compost metagenome]
MILAAGMGKRLGELTKHNTKCMIEVNGVTLINRLLNQLDKQNLERIVIVTGYEEKNLKEHIAEIDIQTPIIYVYNKDYDKTNNIYSLYLASDFLAEKDTILFESDLIFEDTILSKIIESEYKNIVLVAKYQRWMDGTVVHLNDKNEITNFITKSNFSFKSIDTYYKTVNIYKFSAQFSRNQYIPFLEAYCKAVGHNEYYEQVLGVINSLEKAHLKALALENEKWYEIDDVQDLDIAEALFANEEDQLPLYQKRYGGYWRFPHLLDFCYLVNPYFPPIKLKEELKSNFDVLLAEYPSGLRVNNLLAGKYFHVREDFVCVGNGASELIKSLMNNIEGKTGIILPSFEEYINRLGDEKAISFTPENEDFSYSAEDLISFFDKHPIQSLLLINPDNPSGNFINKEDLFILCNWTLNKGIRLILDESFVDFTEDYENNTLLTNTVLKKYSNLVIIKSISKSYGVPGLRLGVLCSSDENLMATVRKDVSIWNINSFGEYYMQIFNKYENDYKEACRNFVAERNRFFKDLIEIKWLRVIPSQANYFLCEVEGKYSSSDLMKHLLYKHNILIKDCSTKSGFNGRNFIRVAVRNTNDNQKLVSALKALSSSVSE